MTAITDLTDAEIASTLAHAESEVARLRGEQERRRRIAEANALADYWKAHPNVIEVKIGDKLLVTEEGNLITHYAIGSVLVIDNFESLLLGGYVGVNPEPDDGTGDIVPINSVSRMRAAYLASVAADGNGVAG